jgi:hypothetical protein
MARTATSSGPLTTAPPSDAHVGSGTRATRIQRAPSGSSAVKPGCGATTMRTLSAPRCTTSSPPVEASRSQTSSPGALTSVP